MKKVVNFFLDACQKKITDAVVKYDIKDFSSLDLEEEVDATSVIMSVSYEENDSRRVQREIIYPLIKYYWDNLRNILDLLKFNNTMEELYHNVCERAFNFCLEYYRINEFRSLRYLLCKHLVSLMSPAQDLTSMRFRITWSDKTAELQMKTRFAQLDVACKLNLWTEAFNILNDLRVIMSRKNCSSSMLASYYEKVSQIFWELKHYFYHAYAQIRLLTLHKRQNRDVTDEELRSMSAQVCLAALCIPSYSVVSV